MRFIIDMLCECILENPYNIISLDIKVHLKFSFPNVILSHIWLITNNIDVYVYVSFLMCKNYL